MRPGRNAVALFEFREIVTFKAAFLLQAELKLHLCMYFENVRNGLVKCVLQRCYEETARRAGHSRLLCVAAALTDDDALGQFSLATVWSGCRSHVLCTVLCRQRLSVL